MNNTIKNNQTQGNSFNQVFPQQTVTFDKNVVQIKGLEVKYDIVPVSNSLALIIGSRDAASVVQQLCYWLKQESGEVIDDVRWIYKSVKEWIAEVFPTYSAYKLGKIMKDLNDRQIIRREKLFTKHQIQKGDRFWWQPKNQTYYYTVNYAKIEELANEFLSQKKAESTETLVFRKLENTKYFDCSKNKTKSTSTDHNRIIDPPPTPPKKDKEREKKEEINFELEDFWLEENQESIVKQSSFSSQIEVKSEPQVDKPLPKHQKSRRVVHKNKNKLHLEPWRSPEELQLFYAALIEALPRTDNARSPNAVAKKIVQDLREGIPNTHWDDFKNGDPIGFSVKQEWEVEPGRVVPQFVEYLAEKLKNPHDDNEKAHLAALRVLRAPKEVLEYWLLFKRHFVRVGQDVQKQLELGVRNPATPLWARLRPEPELHEVAAASKNLALIDARQHSVQQGLKSVSGKNISE